MKCLAPTDKPLVLQQKFKDWNNEKKQNYYMFKLNEETEKKIQRIRENVRIYCGHTCIYVKV